MRRVLIVICLSVLSLCPSAFGLTYGPDNFVHEGKLKGPFRNGQLYNAGLNADLLEKCSPGCRDLRLFDAGGREVPYVLIENRREKIIPSTYQMEIKDFMEKSGRTVVTLKMPEKYEPVTGLTLDIPDHDFSKSVLVEGSKDSLKWTTISRDLIYDFTSQVDLRKLALDFSPADFRYFRLTITDLKHKAGKKEKMSLTYDGLNFSVEGGGKRQIRIRSVMARSGSETEATAVKDELVMSSYRREQDRNTIISFETGVPFTRVSFDIRNPFFFRKVSVLASDTGREKSYLSFHQDQLYHFYFGDAAESRKYLDVTGSGRRYYRIVIENGNNPPLDIAGIRLSWPQKSIYFVALGDADEYSLRVGNSMIKAPEYDLSRSVNQSNWTRFSPEKAEIYQLKRNDAYRPLQTDDSKARKEKMVLTGVIVLLVIGMGYWLYSLLLKTGKDNVQGNDRGGE